MKKEQWKKLERKHNVKIEFINDSSSIMIELVGNHITNVLSNPYLEISLEGYYNNCEPMIKPLTNSSLYRKNRDSYRFRLSQSKKRLNEGIQIEQNHKPQFQEDIPDDEEESLTVKLASTKISCGCLITARKQLRFQCQCKNDIQETEENRRIKMSSSILQYHHSKQPHQQESQKIERKAKRGKLEELSTRHSSQSFIDGILKDQIIEHESSQQRLSDAQQTQSYTSLNFQDQATKFESLEFVSELKKQNFIPFKRKHFKEQYEIQETIGSGAFGIIYKCQHKVSKVSRVVKIISKPDLANNRSMIRTKIQILRKLDHPNIIKMYEIFEWKQNLYFVIEYCEGGDLTSYLGLHANRLTAEIKQEILKQFFKGINYMHEVGVLHRDIKPENILLAKKLDEHSQIDDVTVKIIDFGLSMRFKEKYVKDWKTVGSPSYMAPEVFKGVYSTKCDNWSCGVVAHILLLGNNPFNLDNSNDILKKQQNYKIQKSSKWNSISQDQQTVLKTLLEKNYLNRKQMSEILKLPYFQTKESLTQSQITAMKTKFLTFRRNRNALMNIFLFYFNFVKANQNIKKITAFFSQLNKSQSGVICWQEMREFFSEINQIFLKKLFQEFDFSLSNSIEFSAFLCAFTNKKDLFSDQNIKQFFSLLDPLKKGRFNIEQLKSFLLKINQTKIDNAQSIFKQLDTDEDGLVTEVEFGNYLLRNNHK